MNLRILVDDRPAVTTKQAAETRGITTAGMRAVIKKQGVRPVGYVDDRTPLYDPDELDRVLPPPGRGAHLRKDPA